MRIAVLSDIHGNLEALEAVLAEVDRIGVDLLYSLGDIVGYGPSPAACVEIVRRRAAVSLTGNHDAAVAGLTSLEDFNEFARSAVEWTAARLDAGQIEYLGSLPYTHRAPDLLLVHASPIEPERWHYIHGMADIDEHFAAFAERLCFVGHSHRPGVYAIGGRPQRRAARGARIAAAGAAVSRQRRERGATARPRPPGLVRHLRRGERMRRSAARRLPGREDAGADARGGPPRFSHRPPRRGRLSRSPAMAYPRRCASPSSLRRPARVPVARGGAGVLGRGVGRARGASGRGCRPGPAAGAMRGGGESQIDESSPDESAPAPGRPEGPAALPDRLREYVEGSLARYDALKNESAGFRRQGWFPSLFLRDPERDVVIEPGPGGKMAVTAHISCARRDLEQRLVIAPADRFELPGADKRFFAELLGALATAAPEIGSRPPATSGSPFCAPTAR